MTGLVPQQDPAKLASTIADMNDTDLRIPSGTNPLATDLVPPSVDAAAEDPVLHMHGSSPDSSRRDAF